MFLGDVEGQIKAANLANSFDIYYDCVGEVITFSRSFLFVFPFISFCFLYLFLFFFLFPFSEKGWNMAQVALKPGSGKYFFLKKKKKEKKNKNNQKQNILFVQKK